MFIASSDIITQNQKQHNDYSQGSDKTTEAAANRVLFSNESEPTITTHGVLSTSQRSQTLVQKCLILFTWKQKQEAKLIYCAWQITGYLWEGGIETRRGHKKGFWGAVNS